MGNITIKGSLSPAAGLARDEVRTVKDTPEVRAYVEAGFADIVDEETGEATPVIPDPPKPPKGNASRDDWAEWLAEHTSIVTEGKDRDALQAEYADWAKINSPTAATD